MGTILWALCKLVLILTLDFSRTTGQGPKPICFGIRYTEPQCILGLGLPLKARREQQWLNVTSYHFPDKHLIFCCLYVSSTIGKNSNN